jgi:hypothetical protein
MGRRAGRLLGLAVLSYAVFFGLVVAGQRGGETFFSNPALSIPILVAALAAIAAGVTGVIARLREDRGVIVNAAILVGAVVALWVSAEIAFPH